MMDKDRFTSDKFAVNLWKPKVGSKAIKSDVPWRNRMRLAMFIQKLKGRLVHVYNGWISRVYPYTAAFSDECTITRREYSNVSNISNETFAPNHWIWPEIRLITIHLPVGW